MSVRLSVTRVLRDKTKQYTADILIPHEKATFGSNVGHKIDTGTKRNPST